MKQVIWSRKADADFDEAYGHALALGPGHAGHLLDLLDEAQKVLQLYPSAGQLISDRGLRKWILRPLPYGLIYEASVDAIMIIRLVHLRTNWLVDT